MTVPAIREQNLIDLRWGDGFELLLRVAVIAERGYCTGIDTSELRRLSGFRPMAEDEIARLREDDPFTGAVQMLAQRPDLARKHADALRSAVDLAAQGFGFERLFSEDAR